MTNQDRFYETENEELHYCQKCSVLLCALHASADKLLKIAEEIFSSIHRGKAVPESNEQLLRLRQAIDGAKRTNKKEGEITC